MMYDHCEFSIEVAIDACFWLSDCFQCWNRPVGKSSSPSVYHKVSKLRRGTEMLLPACVVEYLSSHELVQHRYTGL